MEIYRYIMTRFCMYPKEAGIKKFTTINDTPALTLPFKILCWNPSGSLGFPRAWTTCLLAWPCNKPFPDPNSNVSICLAYVSGTRTALGNTLTRAPAKGRGLKCPKRHGTISSTIVYKSKRKYPQGGYGSTDSKAFIIKFLSKKKRKNHVTGYLEVRRGEDARGVYWEMSGMSDSPSPTCL